MPASPLPLLALLAALPLAAPAFAPPTPLAAPEAASSIDAWLALDSTVDPALRTASLRALLAVLPDKNFPRLLDALVDRGGADGAPYRRIAFEAWCERDPSAAARWASSSRLASLLQFQPRFALCEQAGVVWSLVDFDAAYAWASGLRDSALRDPVARRLLAELAATDPRRAVALARKRGPQSFERAFDRICTVWASHDPVATVRELGPVCPPPLEHRHSLHVALGRWADSDPDSALDWLLAHDKPDQISARPALRSFLLNSRTLVRRQQPLAEALLRHPALLDRVDQLAALLDAWSRADADAALAWLDSVTAPDLREEILERLVRGRTLAPGDHLRRLAFALRLSAAPSRDEKIGKLVAESVEENADATRAWLAARPHPALAQAFVHVETALIAHLVAENPGAAVERWRKLPASPTKFAAVPDIAVAWARSDPEKATRWFGDNIVAIEWVEPSVWAATLHAWARPDPITALRWAESLASPHHRRHALASLHDFPEVPDRARVADLLVEIRDPEERAEHLEPHLVAWLRADLFAARRWIEVHKNVPRGLAAGLLAATSDELHRYTSQ